jgi:cell division protein FtsI (penicillin-binding protein 3)
MTTLDVNLQYLIRQELLKFKKIFNTVGSAALLMDVNNGEVLSLVSLPDYNLNKRFSIVDKVYTNKITKGVYELGSVFKTFTLAAALDNNDVKADTIFENLESKIYCA